MRVMGGHFICASDLSHTISAAASDANIQASLPGHRSPSFVHTKDGSQASPGRARIECACLRGRCWRNDISEADTCVDGASTPVRSVYQE
jgi:hypothetical protein